MKRWQLAWPLGRRYAPLRCIAKSGRLRTVNPSEAGQRSEIADERAVWPRLISPARLANRAIKNRHNDQLKFTTDETDASVRYFGHAGIRRIACSKPSSAGE